MEEVRSGVRPFGLGASAESAWARAALGVAAPTIERLLGLTALGRMYAEATGPALVEDFPERALAHLGITWTSRPDDVASIPADGPLVVVANHPFGAADGLVLLAMLRRARRDVRLLGNYLLERIPELRQLIIAVDPFGGAHARSTNRSMLRRAVDWTKRGGAVIVFPAGEVAATRAPLGTLIDGPWRRGVARLVAESGASVLPVYFEGRNSRGFELLGRVSPRFRTALLPRELLRRRGQPVQAVVGTLIPPGQLEGLDDVEVVRYLRSRTYGLRPSRSPMRGPAAGAVPLVDPTPADALATDIAALPADRLLASHRDLRVYYGSADELPHILPEIGRLREATFRTVGEGTGRSIDLDRFDRHYRHLFVWHETRQQVVGAYRIGETDRILTEAGRRGLYTRTLFRYGRRFLDALGPALELGRSFVRAEHQRDFAALMLLWQGIGQFVVRHPTYRRLFGAVSISADYRPASRDLIASALGTLSRQSPFADLATARRPYRPMTGSEATALVDRPGSAHDVISEIEADGRGIPVLLRQYLKLNAIPVAVNVDPAFANVLDALMVVDLDLVQPAVLARYMGKDGARRDQSSRSRSHHRPVGNNSSTCADVW